MREDVYMGAPPGYSKITFRSVLGQRGTEQLTWVHLSFTKAGGEEVQLPVLPHLGAAWSIDTLFEGWGLTSVKFIWDDMTPDGRPRVTMSFR